MRTVTRKVSSILSLLWACGCGPGPKPPLHAAACAGDDEAVTRILNQGGNIEERDDQNMTPLLCAANSKHPSTVRLLLSRGADVLAAVDGTGMRALDFAAQEQDYSMVRLLLENGAVAGCREPLTLTNEVPALLWASDRNDRRLVRTLLNAGCQADARYAPSNERIDAHLRVHNAQERTIRHSRNDE